MLDAIYSRVFFSKYFNFSSSRPEVFCATESLGERKKFKGHSLYIRDLAIRRRDGSENVASKMNLRSWKAMASFPTHFRLSILYRPTHCCKEHHFQIKDDYYSSLIYSVESDSKTLFRTITRLLHGKADKPLTTSSSAVDPPINSSTFFEEKIVNIRSNLGTPVIPDFFRTLDTLSLTCQLVNFALTSNTELSNMC